MTGRRGGNRIRGPQSALTDFLAANNISAQQIRDDYDRRRQQAAADAGEGAAENEDDEVDEEEQAAAEAAIARTKKKRKDVQDAAISKIKNKKGKAKAKDVKKRDKKGKGKKRGSGSDEEDEESEYNSDASAEFKGYKKTVKLPGQLENCELCSKRFTVTPYSKSGPDGGLLCTPCGKELSKEAEKSKKDVKKKAGPTGKKRRKMESDKMDGNISLGAKTLQQLCLEKASACAEDVDDLGDLPDRQMKRLSEIFTKKRVMKSTTFPLFLQPDNEQVIVHDCAYLDNEDFIRMFATSPRLTKIVFDNACQFKNPTMEYMIEKNSTMKWLHLYATNLINNEIWTRYFTERGSTLEALQLADLDTYFEDEHLQLLVDHCPRLTRLKLKRCRRLTTDCLSTIANLKNLQHLSLCFSTGTSVPNDLVTSVLISIGPNLRTLSMENFLDLDDTMLETLGASCSQLSKFRLSTNDTITDAAWANFFSSWQNPALRFIDVSRTRDVNNSNPDGPKDEPIGIGANAFPAMMQHSRSKLQYLHIASCRHIPYSSLTSVWDGTKQYPELLEVDLSFVSNVDTYVLAGLFKSAPKLRKVVAFSCFSIEDVVVPQGVVVIGVPRAQDAIEKFGMAGMDVDNALGGMLDRAMAMQIDVGA